MAKNIKGHIQGSVEQIDQRDKADIQQQMILRNWDPIGCREENQVGVTDLTGKSGTVQKEIRGDEAALYKRGTITFRI